MISQGIVYAIVAALSLLLSRSCLCSTYVSAELVRLIVLLLDAKAFNRDRIDVFFVF